MVILRWVGHGGDGGNSGKAVTILVVTARQVLDALVGAPGVNGVHRSRSFTVVRGFITWVIQANTTIRQFTFRITK